MIERGWIGVDSGSADEADATVAGVTLAAPQMMM